MPDRNVAVGAAVRLMMAQPAFDRLAFGEWVRALDAQMQRGHYGFAINDRQEVRGFIAWALTTRQFAEAWAVGSPLTAERCDGGDCLIVNAWVEVGPEVHRFMFNVFRQITRGHDQVYARRLYPDGRTRVMRLAVASLDTARPDRVPDTATAALGAAS